MAEALHIGLIGGIGVAATAAYYQRLTAAVDRPIEITIAHAQARDLLAHFNADNRQAQAEVYAGLIRRLAAAGCDCVALTSLGGHFCFAETVPLSALPLVSGITPLEAYFQQEDLRTIGILGTGTVMQTGFYGGLHKTGYLAPETECEAVGQRYQELAIRGQARPGDQVFFFEAGARLVARGAQAVVLGGTDLNLVFDGTDPGYRVIDALDIHVGVLAKLATGRMALEDLR